MKKNWMLAAAREIVSNDLVSVKFQAATVRDIIAKHHASLAPEPGHIHDWAAKAGAYLHAEGVPLSSHRIAAVVAFFAEPLVKLLRETEREHARHPDDSLDDCPLLRDEELNKKLHIAHACDCGADEWNARIRSVLEGDTTLDRQTTCINCHTTFGSTAFGFGPRTPPGAERREAGPFCEQCYNLIREHCRLR